MRKLMLLAGAAALGLSLPALAKEEGGQGRGRGGGHAAERSHGGGHGQVERGGGRERHARPPSRGRGGGDAERAAGRGRGGDERRAERRGPGRGDDFAGRGRGGDSRAERRLHRDQRRAERVSRAERRIVRQAAEQRGDRNVREARREQGRGWREWSERRLAAADRFRDDLPGWSDGRRRGVSARNFCPPGLARQNPFCMPPGQLRRAQLIGRRPAIADWAYNVPERYRYRLADDADWFYRYDNEGYVYRFDRGSGLVSSIVPIFATDLLVGEPLPLGYEVYNVPLAYRPWYQDTPNDLYRYDDGAIYQVDANSGLVEGIVALLTGGVGGLGGLGVGDLLPSGYDAYNVPLDYRDQYADSQDAWYRYADGSIYEVDPQTRIIQEIISLIA